jgi:hypothetical protein
VSAFTIRLTDLSGDDVVEAPNAKAAARIAAQRVASQQTGAVPTGTVYVADAGSFKAFDLAVTVDVSPQNPPPA